MMIVSGAFVPSLMIGKLTTKWAMALSIFGYSSYIAAQFYPTLGTMVPTAILLGLGATPMWAAKCNYISQVCLSSFL